MKNIFKAVLLGVAGVAIGAAAYKLTTDKKKEVKLDVCEDCGCTCTPDESTPDTCALDVCEPDLSEITSEDLNYEKGKVIEKDGVKVTHF